MSEIRIADTEQVKNAFVYGYDESIKASKYPMSTNIEKLNSDLTDTAKRLGSSGKGEGHDQFLTGINVSFDLKLSNKAWVEAERYRFLYFVSSQSTMHRISKFDIKSQCNEYVDERIIDILTEKVNYYNSIDPELKENKAEAYLSILYNVPSGFEITARLTTNYRELKTIYAQRKNHRLPEWREFCKWIEALPHFKELCLDNN